MSAGGRGRGGAEFNLLVKGEKMIDLIVFGPADSVGNV